MRQTRDTQAQERLLITKVGFPSLHMVTSPKNNESVLLLTVPDAIALAMIPAPLGGYASRTSKSPFVANLFPCGTS